MRPVWLAKLVKLGGGSLRIPVLEDRLDPTARAGFERAMSLAGERIDASDLLGRSPDRAESINLLIRAADALEEAVRQIGNGTASKSVELTFAPEEIVKSLQGLKERLGATPPADADLSAEDLRYGHAARRIIGRTHSSLRKLARTRQTAIRRRIGGTFVILGIVAVATVALVRLHDRFEVVASDVYSPMFEAERAVDGDLAAEWLAPDDRSAWLELRFARPVDVAGVKVVNSHNSPFNDRATRDLDVELYRKDRLLARAEATFAGIDPSAAARTIAVKAEGITRVRFVARTFYGRGAGLAEVEVIEARTVSQ